MTFARRSLVYSAVWSGATAIANLERLRSLCPSSSGCARRAAARWPSPLVLRGGGVALPQQLRRSMQWLRR